MGPLSVAGGPGGAGARVDGVGLRSRSLRRGRRTMPTGCVDFDDDEQAAST